MYSDFQTQTIWNKVRTSLAVFFRGSSRCFNLLDWSAGMGKCEPNELAKTTAL